MEVKTNRFNLSIADNIVQEKTLDLHSFHEIFIDFVESNDGTRKKHRTRTPTINREIKKHSAKWLNLLGGKKSSAHFLQFTFTFILESLRKFIANHVPFTAAAATFFLAHQRIKKANKKKKLSVYSNMFGAFRVLGERESRKESYFTCAYKKSHCNLHLALNNSNDTQFHFIHYELFSIRLVLLLALLMLCSIVFFNPLFNRAPLISSLALSVCLSPRKKKSERGQ